MRFCASSSRPVDRAKELIAAAASRAQWANFKSETLWAFGILQCEERPRFPIQTYAGSLPSADEVETSSLGRRGRAAASSTRAPNEHEWAMKMRLE